jgi:hypothetical protein
MKSVANCRSSRPGIGSLASSTIEYSRGRGFERSANCAVCDCPSGRAAPQVSRMTSDRLANIETLTTLPDLMTCKIDALF